MLSLFLCGNISCCVRSRRRYAAVSGYSRYNRVFMCFSDSAMTIPSAIRDALALAGRTGVDVRLVLPYEADHTAVHYASLYYLRDLLDTGVKIYMYTNGFVHAKVWLADGKWASVGTANLDNRSLLLNFEVNCLINTPRVVAELEEQFRQDLEQSIRLEAKTFARRPLAQKLAENVCRLFSPVL